MEKLRRFYLKDNDLRISIFKNIYQSILVIFIYNGIANRTEISNLSLYTCALPVIIFSIYLAARLIRSVNKNLQKCDNESDLILQMTKKEKGNSISYLIISIAWVFIFSILFYSTEKNNLGSLQNNEKALITNNLERKIDSIFSELSKRHYLDEKLTKNNDSIKNIIRVDLKD